LGALDRLRRAALETLSSDTYRVAMDRTDERRHADRRRELLSSDTPKLRGERGRRPEALGWIGHHRAGDDVDEGSRPGRSCRYRRRLHLTAEHLSQNRRGGGSAREERPSTKRFPQHGADAVDIDPCVGGIVGEEHFRRQILACGARCVRRRCMHPVRADDSCDSVQSHENAFGRQLAMEQFERLPLGIAEVVNGAEAGQHIDEHTQGNLEGGRLQGRHELRPAHAVDEVADHEHVLGPHHHFANAHDARVLERGKATRIAHPVCDVLIAMVPTARYALDDDQPGAIPRRRLERGPGRNDARAKLTEQLEPLRARRPARAMRIRNHLALERTPSEETNGSLSRSGSQGDGSKRDPTSDRLTSPHNSNRTVEGTLEEAAAPAPDYKKEKMRPFARFAWALLVYDIGTTAWGAYVRATGSGAGCGRHWPLCNGEVVPRAARIETAIELSHRVSSGVALGLTAGLFVWSLRAYPRGHTVRRGAGAAAAFMGAEALIGAALVLFELVARDASAKRALSVSLHLVNTFFLIASTALTAWWASGGAPVRIRGRGAVAWTAGLPLVAMLFVGSSGAVTALGDTLFPSASVAAGLAQDFAPNAHLFVRVRALHPLFAVLAAALVVTTAGITRTLRPTRPVRVLTSLATALVVTQVAAGLLDIVTLAPVWLQLVHLVLADAVWLALVLTAAAALAETSAAVDPPLRPPAPVAPDPRGLQARSGATEDVA
jgi:cytochrome c oxidase assembly protein subunit 15